MVDKKLFTSDWHICSKCPGKRIDADFFKTQREKLYAFAHYVVDNGITTVVHGGDLFDSPKPDYSILNTVISILRFLKKHNCTFFMVLGSHDMYGYNTDSLNQTAVGVLLKSNLVQLLDSVHCHTDFTYHKELPGDMVNKIYGVPALLNHSAELYKAFPDGSIVVTHNSVLPVPVQFEHVLFKDIPGEKKLFLCGHFHTLFHEKVNKNIFINTGPLIRTDINEAQHTPNAVILEFENNKLARISRQQLFKTNARVFSDVPDKIISVNFIDSLQNTKFNFHDLFDLTKQIGKNLNISDAIIQKTLDKLDAVQKENING